MKAKKLKCLSFILLLFASFYFVAHTWAAGETSTKPIVWKAATLAGKTFWTSESILWLADELKTKTNGRLTIELYPGGSSGIEQPAALSAVRDGLVEMMEIWGAAVSSELKAFETQTLPGLVPGDLKVRRSVSELVTPAMADLVNKHNAWLYCYVMAEPRQLFSRVQINNLAEMKGKKIRTQGTLENDYTKRLGAAPVSMGAVDVTTSLQRGVIDGAWMTDAGGWTYKWYEVSKYIIDLNDGGPTCSILINRDAFKALPKDLQTILIEMQPKFVDKIWENMLSLSVISRKSLIEKGMKVVSWPEEEMKKKQVIATSIWEGWYKTADEGARKIFDMTDSYIKKTGHR